MSYEAFKARVNALIRRYGSSITVRFSNDKKNGKFYANCSNGITITASPCGLMATVKWGSGSTSMATI